MILWFRRVSGWRIVLSRKRPWIKLEPPAKITITSANRTLEITLVDDFWKDPLDEKQRQLIIDGLKSGKGWDYSLPSWRRYLGRLRYYINLRWL